MLLSSRYLTQNLVKCSLRRLFFLRNLEKINLDEWVEKTEGFTIDHINELILLFFVFGHTEDEAFEELFKMTKTKGMLKNTTSVSKSSIGFGSH